MIISLFVWLCDCLGGWNIITYYTHRVWCAEVNCSSTWLLMCPRLISFLIKSTIGWILLAVFFCDEIEDMVFCDGPCGQYFHFVGGKGMQRANCSPVILPENNDWRASWICKLCAASRASTVKFTEMGWKTLYSVVDVLEVCIMMKLLVEWNTWEDVWKEEINGMLKDDVSFTVIDMLHLRWKKSPSSLIPLRGLHD